MSQSGRFFIRPATYHEYLLGLMLFPESVKHFSLYQLYILLENNTARAVALFAAATVSQPERAYHVEITALDADTDNVYKIALLNHLKTTALQLCAQALYSVRPTDDPSQIRFFKENNFDSFYNFIGWQFNIDILNRFSAFNKRIEKKINAEINVVPYTRVDQNELQALHLEGLNYVPPGFFHAFSNSHKIQSKYTASRCILFNGKLAGLVVASTENETVFMEATITRKMFRIRGGLGLLLYHFFNDASKNGITQVQMFCDSRNQPVMNIARKLNGVETWRRTQFRLEL